MAVQYRGAQHKSDDLPEWAYRLVKLGTAFVSTKHTGLDDVIVLLVPTRAFASVFLAAGIVLGEMLERIVSYEEHFDWLCSLAPGTEIQRPNANAEKPKIRAVVVKTEEEDQRRLLTLRDLAGKGKDKNLRKLSLNPLVVNWLPKHAYVPPLNSTAHLLARHVVAEEETWFISTANEPSVTIVGERKTLIAEVNTPLIEGPTNPEHRSLDSLLLVNEHQYQQTLRRVRFESRRRRESEVNQFEGERLVIFDGGRAFLNRSREHSNVNRVIVMEYGDQDLTEVVDQLHQFWADRVDQEEEIHIKLPSPPRGCELAHFQVRHS